MLATPSPRPECMEKAQAKSGLALPKIDNDVNIKLNEEFLMELRSNAYRGTNDEDVVNHTAKVLEMLNLIKTPNVDTYHLRMMVFPLSLVGDARQWWINEGDGKITAWEEIVEKIFYHRRVDEGTKKALLYSWVKGNWNEEPMDDIVSSDEEWEESDYGNPLTPLLTHFLNIIWMLKKKITVIKFRNGINATKSTVKATLAR
ncbi:hypothetical protein Tco_0185736 [Tanacetum coccineum]